MEAIGYTAIISIFSHVLFIYLTWRVMVALNVEPLIRKNHVTEARIFLFLVAIAIGSGVSRFVLDIIDWSQNLQYLL
ncbi:MAG TPA: DUF1146 family protein [Bacillota bacterium]|nr:DUF1146 family protein [Bacillota bacterium]